MTLARFMNYILYTDKRPENISAARWCAMMTQAASMRPQPQKRIWKKFGLGVDKSGKLCYNGIIKRKEITIQWITKTVVPVNRNTRHAITLRDKKDEIRVQYDLLFNRSSKGTKYERHSEFKIHLGYGIQLSYCHSHLWRGLLSILSTIPIQ